jgi:hypothetical protein
LTEVIACASLLSEIARSITVAREVVEGELRRQNPELPLLSPGTSFRDCALKNGPNFIANITGELTKRYNFPEERRITLHEFIDHTMLRNAQVDHLVKEIAIELTLLMTTG